MYELTYDGGGAVEVVDADGVSVPSVDIGLGFGARNNPPPCYHFYRHHRLVLSVRAEKVESVREVLREESKS